MCKRKKNSATAISKGLTRDSRWHLMHHLSSSAPSPSCIFLLVRTQNSDIECRRRRLNLTLVFCVCFALLYIFWLVNVCFCCVRFSFQWLRERLWNDLFCVEWDIKPQSILPTWLPFPAYPAGCMCARVCVCDINVLWLNARSRWFLVWGLPQRTDTGTFMLGESLDPFTEREISPAPPPKKKIWNLCWWSNADMTKMVGFCLWLHSMTSAVAEVLSEVLSSW